MSNIKTKKVGVHYNFDSDKMKITILHVAVHGGITFFFALGGAIIGILINDATWTGLLGMFIGIAIGIYISAANQRSQHILEIETGKILRDLSPSLYDPYYNPDSSKLNENDLRKGTAIVTGFLERLRKGRRLNDGLWNDEHLDILSKGVDVWNEWRDWNPSIKPHLIGLQACCWDLGDANLSDANLQLVDFRGANLAKANLSGADLSHSDLSEANLCKADMQGASLRNVICYRSNLSNINLESARIEKSELDFAILSNAKLYQTRIVNCSLYNASLSGADLRKAFIMFCNLRLVDFSASDLRGCKLNHSTLVDVNLSSADLRGANVYGTSVWNANLDGAVQEELHITIGDEPTITTDNLEVAQFIYLMLKNPRIRQVIDSITARAVLILGRFSSDRKMILDEIRIQLRKAGYLPILFDFEGPDSRDLTETISTLAHLSKFVIADITEAKSIPQELQAIVPNLPSVPVLPMLFEGHKEYGMFEHFRRYPWVLPVQTYESMEHLRRDFLKLVIAPAERMANKQTSES